MIGPPCKKMAGQHNDIDKTKPTDPTSHSRSDQAGVDCGNGTSTAASGKGEVSYRKLHPERCWPSSRASGSSTTLHLAYIFTSQW